jgi:tRNA(Ile)-lysidine synthase
VTGPDPAVAAVRVAVRHALAADPPGTRILVACSGGADSLALAAAALFEGRAAAMDVGAVTVDHGLQEGSAQRAQALAATLVARGFDPVEVIRVEVAEPGPGRPTGGPEAAARSVRYAALDAAADRYGAAAILLGHTRDDQAETVLLGLARGSGARSLAGMAPASGRYRRPLLGIERATTRRAALAEGYEPWDDPHNVDPAYTRVRVRQDALPGLERAIGPGVAAALARTADQLRADADALDGWAATAAKQAEDARGSLAVGVLGELPTAVRRRVLRRAAVAAGVPAGSLAAVHIEALDALVVDWHGQGTVDLPGGVGARRACDRLSFLPRVRPWRE